VFIREICGFNCVFQVNCGHKKHEMTDGEKSFRGADRRGIVVMAC